MRNQKDQKLCWGFFLLHPPIILVILGNLNLIDHLHLENFPNLDYFLSLQVRSFNCRFGRPYKAIKGYIN